jgi:hypothetical protein
MDGTAGEKQWWIVVRWSMLPKNFTALKARVLNSLTM